MALSELPLHHSFRLSSGPHLRRLLPLRFLSSRHSFSSSAAAAPSASSPSSSGGNRTAPPAPSTGAPWLQKWAPSDPSQPAPAPAALSPTTSIDRIVHRLRNLGLASDDDDPSAATATAPPDGTERLGDLLDRSWARPDRQFAAASFDDAVLPWERDEEAAAGSRDEEDGVKRRRVKAPSLAELTIEDEELRRLRRLGMTLRDRITVPKAGVTTVITEKIHDAWRKSELVRLKFHEDLAHDMKTAHELVEAQAKIHRAERLLSKIEASMVLADPSDDKEMITDEEKSVFRRIGLRLKAYLPLGVRGVFDGVIENMHLHWKHREVVKLISKQKTLSFVQETARLLEYESGGILVAIERVPKGYALIFYRGKNYRRPINIRPRNLLTKAKALKRAVAMQRHEALSQHIDQLESNIKQMKLDLGIEDYEEQEEDNSDSESEDGTAVTYASYDEDQEDFDESADEDEYDDYDDDENEEIDSIHR
nr:unnamed protein product [Digitaria exilis]